MLFENLFETGSRHHPVGIVQEERCVANFGSDRDPSAHCGSGLLPERQHAFSSSFADDVDAGWRSPVELVEPDADEFGNAQRSGKQMPDGSITDARCCARRAITQPAPAGVNTNRAPVAAG
ncbi:hypothetical protein [Sulfitobacter faviae]|uniref:hypothetical protein n=1 Tax=Sulfitobacter faviae TaxID=1775881 RepID=UPI00398D43A1